MMQVRSFLKNRQDQLLRVPEPRFKLAVDSSGHLTVAILSTDPILKTEPVDFIDYAIMYSWCPTFDRGMREYVPSDTTGVVNSLIGTINSLTKLVDSSDLKLNAWYVQHASSYNLFHKDDFGMAMLGILKYAIDTPTDATPRYMWMSPRVSETKYKQVTQLLTILRDKMIAKYQWNQPEKSNRRRRRRR